jgi:hypothetical protein
MSRHDFSRSESCSCKSVHFEEGDVVLTILAADGVPTFDQTMDHLDETVMVVKEMRPHRIDCMDQTPAASFGIAILELSMDVMSATHAQVADVEVEMVVDFYEGDIGIACVMNRRDPATNEKIVAHLHRVEFRHTSDAMKEILQRLLHGVIHGKFGKLTCLAIDNFSDSGAIPAAVLQGIREMPVCSSRMRPVLQVSNVHPSQLMSIFQAVFMGTRFWDHVHTVENRNDLLQYFNGIMSRKVSSVLYPRQRFDLQSRVQVKRETKSFPCTLVVMLLNQHIFPNTSAALLRQMTENLMESDRLQVGDKSSEPLTLFSRLVFGYCGAFRHAEADIKEAVERWHQHELGRKLKCVCKQPLSSPANTQTGALSFEMWALVESTNYKTTERKLRQRVGARLRQKEHVPFFLDLMEDVLGVGPIDSRYLMDRIEFHETNRVF